MTPSPKSLFPALLLAASTFALSACSADSLYRFEEMMASAGEELALQLAGEDAATAPEELTEEELMALAVLLSEEGVIDYGALPPGYAQTAGGYGAGSMGGYGAGSMGSYGAGSAGGWMGESFPTVSYDPYSYQDPDSVDYDAYEVDSEGWSGGAYENPESSYYDAGSYDSGSYDY